MAFKGFIFKSQNAQNDYRQYWLTDRSKKNPDSVLVNVVKVLIYNSLIHWMASEATGEYTEQKKQQMTKLILILLVITVFAACNTTTKNPNQMEDKNKQTGEVPVSVDTTPKVTGIGGIFFFSGDPEKSKQWYANNLGLEVNDWGSTFEFRNANQPDEINYLQWSPFKRGSEYFAPSEKDFMINYRVQNIEGLVRKLRENGVTIVDTIETYDYGKFVHIMDAEGNKIELWEPVDSVFTAMGGKTTK